MDFHLDRAGARSITAVLLGCVAVLTVTGAFALGWRDQMDQSMLMRHYVAIFNPDWEQTIPAWFSSCLMLMIAAACALVARDRRRDGGGYARRWMALVPIFLYLSADESVALHERVGTLIKHVVHTSGIFTFAWVIPALAVLVVLAVVYFPFVRALPRGVRGLVALSGSLYVGGALGMEMVGGVIKTRYGAGDLYFTAVTIEEFLEMVGLVTFLGAALRLLTEEAGAGSGVQGPPVADTPARLSSVA